MHTNIGTVTFGNYELDISAITGELASHARETRRDTASIRAGERMQQVSVTPAGSVPLRVGHKVTAYYASLRGMNNWQLVAFSDDSAHKVHDVSRSACLPGAKPRVFWLAPLAVLGIGKFSDAIFPWIAYVAATMSVSPEATAYAYVACAWGSAIASCAYLLRRSRVARKNAAQRRTSLLQFIENNAAGATRG
ncbi:hypothetical protein KZJ38_07320 [Paraburkholderia edwinii]|uniref:Transmembrane protein n=1 Tax=Paraburkholderia edwinii TaxID=2861782 RepID=A0ABX8UM93_9BURK|nr:hypothetical protein [Paraburkholderia edwinii]QYD70110.1 hypothetical protein KZJ38_07320 [Paraburkholderia edwinii]